MNAILRKRIRTMLVALLLLAATAATAQTPGTFDTSWRPNGRIIIGAAGASAFYPADVAVVDGGVVVAGSCGTTAVPQGCAFRLGPSGNIDPAWGDPFVLNNVVRSDLVGLSPATTGFGAFLAAVDPAGRVTWLRRPLSGAAQVGRLNASGTAASVAATPLDLLVGEGGEQLHVRMKATASHVYVGGGVDASGSNYDAALARLDADLGLDPTFNGSGVRRVGFDGAQMSRDFLYEFVVAPDDRVYAVVGSLVPSTGTFGYWIVCYNPDGSLCTGFGVGGRAPAPVADAENMFIALDSQGRVVLGGFYFVTNPDYDVYVARLTGDGAADPTFGVAGVSRFGIEQVANAPDVALEVAVQPDDKPIVAGKTRDSSGANALFVARLSQDGVLDFGFGTGGVLVSSFGGSLSNGVSDEAWRLAFDPEGRLYVVGTNYNPNFELTRVGVGRIVTGVVIEPPADPVFDDGFE
jgi:uncharacterized delta-60 repeat protein